MSEARTTVPSMDPRARALPGRVDVDRELTYLRAGSDPPWERPRLDGVDITDRPDLQTPYQRQRRAEFDARVEGYRSSARL